MPSVSFRVNPEYADVTEIVPGLFVCGVSALTLQCMEKLNITLIINATEEASFFFLWPIIFSSIIAFLLSRAELLFKCNILKNEIK